MKITSSMASIASGLQLIVAEIKLVRSALRKGMPTYLNESFKIVYCTTNKAFQSIPLQVQSKISITNGHRG